ncbi:MAG: hypothetical protein L0Y72_21145 [Gemmataceae bacterium]|nr:hypothetical protein [Gemmataceae bacterium]MCI0741549.1 hypothetical protein [Gemmataceae bacterium]
MSNYRSAQRLFAVLAVFFALMAHTGRLQAQPKDITSPFFFPEKPETKGKWKIEWDDKVVKLQFDDTTAPNTTVGTLIDITVRGDDKATTITFTQTVKLDENSSVKNGLRLNFTTKVKNGTTTKWEGYLLQLFDDQPVFENPPDKMHPPLPHFHPNTGPATFAPFVKYVAPKDPDVVLNVGDGVNFVEKDGEINRFFEAKNLLIHEREFAKENVEDPPGVRKFRLYQRPISVVPIPDPGCETELQTGGTERPLIQPGKSGELQHVIARGPRLCLQKMRDY